MHIKRHTGKFCEKVSAQSFKLTSFLFPSQNQLLATYNYLLINVSLVIYQKLNKIAADD